MDQSFADRLARIQTTQTPEAVTGGETMDLIGSTNRNTLPSMQELYPTAKHKTYDQKFKMAIVNNLILGLIWMLPTGYAAANFLPVADFLAGADPSDQSVLNIRVGMGVGLLVSFGLFYWVGREALRDLGKAHGMPASLAIGGAIGAVIGIGPATVFRLFLEYSAA